MSRLDSNESNNVNKGSKYHPLVSESSARNQLSKSTSILPNACTRSTTEKEISNNRNNSNIRSNDLSKRIANGVNKEYNTDREIRPFYAIDD